MTSHIVLGIKVEVGPIKRVKIPNVNLQCYDMKALKDEASKQSNIPPETLEFVHQGRIIEEKKSLKDYGVKSGDTVYVLRKNDSTEGQDTDLKETYTPENVTALFKSYYISTRSVASFSTSMETVLDPSSIDKFIKIEPELANDPIALSYLTAPELVFLLQDPETFESVSKKHPILIPAFFKIFKDVMPVRTRRIPPAPMTLQHIDSEEEEDVELGDGDDDGAEEDGDSQAIGGGLITPEQLSAALAMAGASVIGNSGSGAASSSSGGDTGLRDFLGSLLAADAPSSSASSSRSLITRDMFSNALSQAISSVSGSTNPAESSSSSSGISLGLPQTDSSVPTPSNENVSGRNFTIQLMRMQEMGLMDYRLNLRALIVSAGDANAAINLVLSGAIED